MKIGLISCSKAKKTYPCPAKEMYSASNLFRRSLEYAEMVCDKVFILSAKHGLLGLDDIIDPYDETLTKKPVAERREWAKEVLSELEKRVDFERDEFLILTGKAYYEFLLDGLKNHRIPLEGMSLFERIPELKRLVNEVDERADILHRMANRMIHYSWNEIDDVEFENGIYLVFESGEVVENMDRIVRIGTHNKDGLLKERLRAHYMRTNKDGSIFRKNVGLALLNRNKDEFLDVWRLNTSCPKVKRENKGRLNPGYGREVEEQVSNYLRENTKFTCFEVETKDERLRIERGLIALLGRNKKYRASGDWLGNHHPDSIIGESYLWNKQGLNGEPLSLIEINRLPIRN